MDPIAGIVLLGIAWAFAWFMVQIAKLSQRPSSMDKWMDSMMKQDAQWLSISLIPDDKCEEECEDETSEQSTDADGASSS